MAANQPARGEGRTLKPVAAAIFRHEQEISSANEQRIAGMGDPARAYNVNNLYSIYIIVRHHWLSFGQFFYDWLDASS
jgi:hypothetical protein